MYRLLIALRRIAAIFFLSILCFNFLGYRYFFDFLEQRHDSRFEAQLDEDDYDESSLISIRTAFSNPYYNHTNSGEFERWKGEIEIDGVHYKYVKRRIFNDSIELLCIPNTTAHELKKAEQDFYRMTNDLQTNSGKKQDGQLPVFKNLLSEYCEAVPDWTAVVAPERVQHCAVYLITLSRYDGESPGQPPEQV